jgi:6-pyruvoyltetrahydropterin/6-carboxytetrahydropterin synthase
LQIRRRFHFEAAHVLPHHLGKCARMHGHSYRLDVAVRGPLREDGPAQGMVVDFDDIKRIVRERVVDVLDHRTLNEFDDNPTVERIVLWAWRHLDGTLAGLDELVLWETDDSCAVLRRSDIPAVP